MRYNIGRFNTKTGIKYLKKHRDLSQYIDCVAGIKRYGAYYRDVTSVIRERAKLGLLMPGGHKIITQAILESTAMRVLMHKQSLPQNSIYASVALSKIIHTTKSEHQEILKNLYLGATLRRRRTTTNAILAYPVEYLVYMFREKFVVDFILSNISAFAVSLITGEIDITLRPGDELRIDSGNYTAVLIRSQQRQNVIDKYSGDWIFITPETIEIIITTGNNRPIVGEIIYKELFI